MTEFKSNNGVPAFAGIATVPAEFLLPVAEAATRGALWLIHRASALISR